MHFHQYEQAFSQCKKEAHTIEPYNGIKLLSSSVESHIGGFSPDNDFVAHAVTYFLPP